jgi:hypothetical protein
MHTEKKPDQELECVEKLPVEITRNFQFDLMITTKSTVIFRMSSASPTSV